MLGKFNAWMKILMEMDHEDVDVLMRKPSQWGMPNILLFFIWLTYCFATWKDILGIYDECWGKINIWFWLWWMLRQPQHEEAMISLKFGKAQYNSFINDDKMKVMCNIDGLNLVTTLKEEVHSMMPRKKESTNNEMRRKEGDMQLSPLRTNSWYSYEDKLEILWLWPSNWK